MPDASYDAIIIGGGHNGLIAACYLGWAGMKVAVFEKEFELGGGACTEEQPLPASPGLLGKLWKRSAKASK